MSWDVSWSVPGPVTGSHSHSGTWSHFKMNTLVINHLKHNSANSMNIADCPPSMGQLLHSGSLVVVTSEYVKFQSGSFNPTLQGGMLCIPPATLKSHSSVKKVWFGSCSI